jgi:hypothetical protein
MELSILSSIALTRQKHYILKDNPTQKKMNTYNLAIAWNWEYDSEFIAGIEHECRQLGLTTYRVSNHNLQQTMSELKQCEIMLEAFFDRASDSDPNFLPFVKLMEEHATYLINPYHNVIHAIDKATMHLEFITHGLFVPHTIILPPYNEQMFVSINDDELKFLHTPFVVKPANTTGGGTGVLLNATKIEDILKARQEHRNDKYLVQETIIPKLLDGKRAWFRVYYAFGEIIPCWWDDQTHRYDELTQHQVMRYGLSNLKEIVAIIQNICRLDFFSSEIVLNDDGKFVVVDYVNEVCDMRMQSMYENGAPDAIVHQIEKLLARHVKAHLDSKMVYEVK